MTYPYSSYEDKVIKQCHTSRIPSIEIAGILKEDGYNRTPASIRGRAQRLGLTLKRKTRPEPPSLELGSSSPPCIPSPTLPVDEVVSTPGPCLPEETRRATPRGGARKILSIADLHIPFQASDILNQVLDEQGDADILVLNGDLMDTYAASTFQKNRTLTLLEEYQTALDLLTALAPRFPAIYLTQGNHEARLSKYLSLRIPPEVSSVLGTDLLCRLARGEEIGSDGGTARSRGFTNVHYDPVAKWIVQLGSALFAHPHSYFSNPGATALKTHNYLYGFLDYDTLVVSHTHSAAKLMFHGLLLIEQGCMCNPLEYQKNPALKYGLHTIAYAVLHQDKDGRTDFRTSDIFFCSVPQKPERRSRWIKD